MKYAQLKAVLALPTMVLIVIPTIICLTNSFDVLWGLTGGWMAAVFVVIILFGCFGISVMIATNRLFSRIGHGTLAPWNPPKKLVVAGPYRYVRNPMILGVFCILAAEVLILGSWSMVIYWGIAVGLNGIYMPLSEERGLEKRFGEAYRTYKRNVPRWIPRIHPWNPPSSQDQKTL